MKLKIFLVLFLCCFCAPSFNVASETVEEIKVVTTPFSPLVIQRGTHIDGFCIDLWNKIASVSQYNFSINVVKNLPALYDQIAAGDADIGVGGIPITLATEKQLDYSYPFFEAGNQIMSIKSATQSQFFSRYGSQFLYAIFSPEILKAFVFFFFMLFLSANIVWFAERRENPDMFPNNYLQGIWESFWWSSVTITTVGYGDKTPRSVVGRMCALVWMFAGIFLISYFTATISSSHTIKHLKNKYNKPHDLIGKQVGTARGSVSYRYLRVIGVRVLQFDTIDIAYEALRKGLISAVVYDAPVLQYYAKQNEYIGYVLGDDIFQKHFLGFCFPPDSPYREKINQAILYLKESGEYDLIYEKWFGTQYRGAT